MRTLIVFCVALSMTQACFAQGRGPDRGTPVPDNPQAIGEAGIAWYTTWRTGLEEAKRTNKPIFFMSAATTCSGGVSGVF